ncbi:MAG: glucose PTS transporter subunit IIA [Lachnospiraceae bacterium]
MNLKDRVFDLITGIMMPSLALLCAAGITKGLNTILMVAGLYEYGSSYYILVEAIGDAMFYFFPIILGFNTARKIGMNEYLGLMIGAALCYPTINGVDLTFFGLTMNVTYTSTFLPVIIIVLLAKPLETFLNKIIPDVVKTFLTPMLVMLVAVPIGFTLIGPIANVVGVEMAKLINNIIEISPMIAGILLGGFYQFIMLLGIHLAIFIPSISSLAAGNPDFPLAIVAPVSFSQMAVVFAIWMKTKNLKLKEFALPAWISGIFGVTEPAIYGITLPRMKFFIISCIGAAISGGLVGFFNTKILTIAGIGIFSLPGFINPNTGDMEGLIHFSIAVVVGMAFSFIATFLMYQDEEIIETKSVSEVSQEVLVSPANGKIIPLHEVCDEAFAQGAMGQGVAIEPREGKIYSPVHGSIITIFPTKHAIGILSENGAEILIHIGMDTVNLNGQYFETHVEQGQIVKKGDLIVSFDMDSIVAEGFSVQTPIIITNTTKFTDIIPIESKEVDVGNDILTLLV